MLEYIKGTIEYFGKDYIVIEANSIGYKIYTSSYTMSELSNKEIACIYTEMIVREDSMTLCGFSTREELESFRLLTSVSKVGTKVGLGILSTIQYEQLMTIIASGDVNNLVKANGVGKKTAERIILELKDKIKNVSVKEVVYNDSIDDARLALLSLGYSKQEISKVFEHIDVSGSVEDIIKNALTAIKR